MKEILLIAHLLLIATGTGMSFANFQNVRYSHGLEGEAARALQGLRRIMGSFGDIIIAGIWFTGILLVWQLKAEGQGDFSGWFYVKLGLVVLLTLCHGLARRTGGTIGRTGDFGLLGRLELYIAGLWLSASLAIIVAVVAFEMD